MSDPANFNKDDLSIIWGMYPSCMICREFAQDFDHVCHRGGKRNRKIHSSVFNACPLCRMCHIHKKTDNETVKKILQKVKETVLYSPYELQKKDHEFLAHYSSFYE